MFIKNTYGMFKETDLFPTIALSMKEEKITRALILVHYIAKGRLLKASI